MFAKYGICEGMTDMFEHSLRAFSQQSTRSKKRGQL